MGGNLSVLYSEVYGEFIYTEDQKQDGTSGKLSKTEAKIMAARENGGFQAQWPSSPYTSWGVKILTVLSQARSK